ncbi:serine/threonine-protein kinase [Metabacillus halosaccharovorans]|uniref:serine/threonine-protein kinase n=1 Tax=Metabacillus halosaccharovorans TaxID=930124 RepID=UPI00203B6B3E|nr:serine/threonine-protein kinase [Metabacillus halosaccharovorans]MCM3441397.1 serine/threonine-protein kinase [Metabacillus halosaccharovorans]
MKNVQQTNPITLSLNKVDFQLQEEHNFDWLKQLGHVFCVFDQQDSGNISFGVEKDGQKYFVKYAGAKPIDFSGNPQDAIERLKKAVPVYQSLEHPHLIKLIDFFSTDNGFAVVFQWFEGECLHSHWSYGGVAKYTNHKSPFYRFKKLELEKRLKALDTIFSFHTYVESKNYVAVDFYDGSILYDFKNGETKICDIDFYRKAPSINDIGKNFWGSNRSKSPEEYDLGSPIDSITNVFNLGAIAFGLLGGEMDRSFSKWDANQALYEVALRSVKEDRNKRYSTVRDFYYAWEDALNQ